MKVINMPVKTGDEKTPDPKKIDKNSVAINQANAILNKRKEEVKGEAKPTTMAGQNIVTGGAKMQQYGDANVGSQ